VEMPPVCWEKVILLRRRKMAKRTPKTQKSPTPANLKELVTVTFVEDTEQAKDYETLLKTNDIPAIIKEQNDESSNCKNIAVMVPEKFLDEAHVVIESQDAYDDFYDFALDDDFDDDLIDEEF